MTIRNIKSVYILALLTFALISCENKENEFDLYKIPANEKILSFNSEKDFEQTLLLVSAMNEDERLMWEKEKGFKSIGTICDEFYENINPEQFKDFDEIINFVTIHSDKIQLIEKSGEFYCEPRFNNLTERYMVNENSSIRIGDNILFLTNDGKFIVDSTSESYSRSNESIFNTKSIIYKVSNAYVSVYDVVDISTIGSDNYKMVFTLSTRNEYDSYLTYIVRQVKLKNYARWLAVWWLRTYSSTYSVKVKGTDITYGNWFLDGPNVTKDVKSEDLLYQRLPGPGGTQNTEPRFTWFNIVASNEKGCSIDSTLSF